MTSISEINSDYFFRCIYAIKGFLFSLLLEFKIVYLVQDEFNYVLLITFVRSTR